jgi:choline dehydrogenase
MQDVYDYIVVGGGASGSVIASRLSAAGSRVLLLEAGGTDRRLDIIVPAGAASAYQHASWDYPVEPDPTRTNLPEGVMAGKVMGGGGSINSCVFVRGNKLDFDGWAALGCDGWDYESVLPYFKRMESWEGGASQHRGGEGPIAVVVQTDRGIANSAFFEAARQAGHLPSEDYNGAAQDGVTFTQVNMRRGLRSQASREYLKRVARRPTLTICTHAMAHRVLFDGDRAIGVEYRHENQQKRALASEEVIVSAGAYSSPKVLLLSGIGPREELARHGIDLVAHVPGVGQNLHDHPVLTHRWTTREVRTVNRVTTSMKLKGLWDFALRGTGLLTQTATPVQVMARSAPTAPKPDWQLCFSPFAFMRDVDEQGIFRVSLAKEDGFTVGSILLDVKSRGRVSLRSASPDDKPLVNYAFLAEAEDVRSVIKGLHELRRIMSQPAMARIIDRPFEQEAGCRSDADWERYTRLTVTSAYHPVGTCKMGVDDQSVVDPQLRVRGVRGLRVADASIMPKITSGNTNAPAMMIGERAADLITKG